MRQKRCSTCREKFEQLWRRVVNGRVLELCVGCKKSYPPGDE